jgi:hypothetical protein
MSTAHPRARLDFKGDRWVAYTPAGQRYAVDIHVSYKPTPDRWVVDEVHYALPRVTPRMLRDLPLGQIEAHINLLAQQGLVDLIEGKTADRVQPDPALGVTWVPKLQDPGGHPKPDEFYRRVAEIYAKAAVASTKPAADLAEAWEVPRTTVHRWVRVARSRGYLPAGESGRRG